MKQRRDSFPCNSCGGTQTRVLDTEYSPQKCAIRRRRLCLSCGVRFTTYEVKEPIIFSKQLVRRVARARAALERLVAMIVEDATES